jgi:hypothetical protein
MAERGLGVLALARRVPCDKALISRLVNGKQHPSPKIARQLDNVLGAGGELATLAEQNRPRSPLRSAEAITPDDGERIMAAARTPQRLDAAVVESLGTVLAAQRRLEDHVGSAVMLEPVTAQVAMATNLVTEARGPLRVPMLRVAGQYAQFAGWLNANIQRVGQAGRWYDRALEWATEGGDHNMVATALSMKGHAAWAAGHIAPMIGLSEAAQNTPGASPGVRALAAQQEARGHALSGDGRQADRKLDEAGALVCRAAVHPEDEPPWVYFFNPDYLVMQRGLAWLYLGRYAQAAGLLAAGLAAMPAEVRESEWVAEYLARLATAHAHAGNPEQACAAAAEAASIARQTGSVRLAGKLDRLSAALTARFPGHGDVVEFAQSLR